MATQYTPILQLALPVTGELNGTWGDVVNDNITSMVEQAIAGLATINTWTANSHTLTTANGTTDEARCAMLVAATGAGGTALTAAGEIICPARTKLYVLSNTSAYTVTLKTAAGSGVAVPAGDTTFLFCDGTNVNACVTTIVNGHISGNLTVDGNTTLGNATTDTITATARFNSDLLPSADNSYDLGTSGNSWRNLYIDGTATIATLNVTTIDTTNLEVTNIKAKDGTASATIADATGVMTIGSSVLTTADINGGTIDGTVIGGAVPAAGTFTTAAATTGNITTVNATTVDTTNIEVTNVKAKDGTAAITLADSTGVATLSAAPVLNAGTANQVQFLNGSKQLVGDADFTFDGTTLSVTNITSSGSVTLSGGTANSIPYLNGSKVLTTGSALTFDGSNLSTVQSDGYNGLRITNTTGKIRMSGYVNGTVGAYIDALNAAESAYATLTVNGNPLVYSINASEQMRLTSTGLGIGTSSPGNKFVVSASGAQGFEVNPNVSGTTEILAYNRSGSAWNPLKIITSNFKINISGSSDALTLDSSGNLGLGVTPSAWNDGVKALQVANSLSLFGTTTDPYGFITNNHYWSATGDKYLVTGYGASYYKQYNGAHTWATAPSGTAGNAISFTQAMLLDAGGNLGIGLTNAASKLTVGANPPSPGAIAAVGSAGGIALALSDNVYASFYVRPSPGGSILGTDGGGALRFATNGNTSSEERMRIDSSGNLLVGLTTNPDVGKVAIAFTPGSTEGLVFKQSIDTSQPTPIIFFNASNSVVGSVITSATTTTYNTSSDYRLKENIQPMQNALDVVARLNPVTYNWKADGSDGQGFIAHELQAVVPDCVTGEKDAVDKDGKPVYQGIDTSFLVGILTKAIQEQQELINQLTARVAQLEGN